MASCPPLLLLCVPFTPFPAPPCSKGRWLFIIIELRGVFTEGSEISKIQTQKGVFYHMKGEEERNGEREWETDKAKGIIEAQGLDGNAGDRGCVCVCV